MNLKPFNRRLIVERIDEKSDKETSSFYIPPEMEEEFSKRKEFELVTVVNKAQDVTLPVSINDKVVILTHMIERIDINGQTLLAVAENNVIGKLL